jgi:hypothetical protein
MICNGRGLPDGGHCCYVEGKVCRFYKHFPNSNGRIHACGLMLLHNDWDKVHNDPGYLKHVRPAWQKTANKLDCGDWHGHGCCYGEYKE